MVRVSSPPHLGVTAVPLSTAARNAAVDALAALGAYISLHTADPGITGASEVAGGTYVRKLTTWAAASTGSRAGSLVNVPVPAGTTVTHAGVWSAASAGTFVGGIVLSAPETFGATGSYDYTPTLTVT
jgi:hypothetical protein